MKYFYSCKCVIIKHLQNKHKNFFLFGQKVSEKRLKSYAKNSLTPGGVRLKNLKIKIYETFYERRIVPETMSFILTGI